MSIIESGLPVLKPAATTPGYLPKIDVDGSITWVDPASLGFAVEPVAADHVYYVSKGSKANDANDGLSPGSPLATIARALVLLGVGVAGKIVVGWGTFTEVVTAYATNGGGTAAVYLFNRDGTILEGVSEAGTLIQPSANCTDVIRVENTGRTIIRNLQVGSGGRTCFTGLHVTSSTSTENVSVYNVHSQSTALVTYGFAVGVDTATDVSETSFYDCKQNGGQYGLGIGNGATGNVGNVQWYGGAIQSNTLAGVRMRGGGIKFYGGTCSNNLGSGDFLIDGNGTAWPILIKGVRSESSFRLLTMSGQQTFIPNIKVEDCVVQAFTDPAKRVILDGTGPGVFILGLVASHVSGFGSEINSGFLPPIAIDVFTDNAGNPFTGVDAIVKLHCGGLNAGGQQASFLPNTSSVDFAVSALGKGFQVKEGANAKQGTAVLVAGTVTVVNTAVTATSRIQLTPQTLGTVARPAAVGVTARVAGTSFTITSSDATDTSTIAYEIFEPA